MALAQGFTAVEFDVMLTRDGHVMLHHDWVMGRCAQSVDAAQHPHDVNTRFEHLSQADLLGYTVEGQPIPSLSQVMAFCLKHSLRANVELKATHPRNAQQLGQAVCALLGQLTAEEHAMVEQSWVFSSFYHASLLPLQAYPLALLYESLPDDWTLHADALNAQAVHLHYSAVNAATVGRIHTTGRVVRVYTVNDLATGQRMQTLGVDGVFTDQMNFYAVRAT